MTPEVQSALTILRDGTDFAVDPVALASGTGFMTVLSIAVPLMLTISIIMLLRGMAPGSPVAWVVFPVGLLLTGLCYVTVSDHLASLGSTIVEQSRLYEAQERTKACDLVGSERNAGRLTPSDASVYDLTCSKDPRS
jgi:hypothetical protein